MSSGGRRRESHRRSPTMFPLSSSPPPLLQGAVNMSTDLGHDQQMFVSYATKMPEKRILELTLDVLQRRDTHEIFAEPVAPEKVKDYYKMIKEPMDFGTMRAKLHEGMYTSLGQFEHDVFLISRNAMSFNSPTTIYFKQAQAIQELAKKVFDALKFNPDNFESEFSETRRRTCRRDLVRTGVSCRSPRSKIPTNMRSRNLVIGVAAKAPSRSLRSLSNLRRGIQVNTGNSTATASLDATEILSGTRVDVKRSDFVAEDRRRTYKPREDLLGGNVSDVSPRQLIHVNGRNIDYRESLMMFVKKLGPSVQIYAKKKLLGLSASDTPSISCHVSSAPTDKGTLPSSSVFQYPRDCFRDLSRVGPDLNDIDERRKNCSTGNISIFGSEAFDNNKKQPDSHFYVDTDRPKRRIMDLNKVDGKAWLTGSALCHCESNVAESRFLESTSSSWFGYSQFSVADRADQGMAQPSGFIFDLPFLKTRLEQIKSAVQPRNKYAD